MAQPERGSRLARLVARLRGQGVRATLAKAIGDHLYRTSDSVFVEYRRGWRAPQRWPELSDGLSFAIVRDGAAVPPLGSWLAWRTADFEAMARGGELGLFLLRDGLAIGCAWARFDDYRDAAAGEHYPVGSGEAYHYCWLLDPGQRRGHAGSALLRGLMALLHEAGVERQFGVVDLVNRASYLLQYRVGYRECGQKVTHRYVLGRRRTRMSRYEGTLGPAPAT